MPDKVRLVPPVSPISFWKTFGEREFQEVEGVGQGAVVRCVVVTQISVHRRDANLGHRAYENAEVVPEENPRPSRA